MNDKIYNWEQFDNDVDKIIKHIKNHKLNIRGIYGIPRGGLILATVLSNKLSIPLYLNLDEDKDAVIFKKKQLLNTQILIVDDISDSGKTLVDIPNIVNHYTITLWKKIDTKFVPNFWCRENEPYQWIVFPWETKEI